MLILLLTSGTVDVPVVAAGTVMETVCLVLVVTLEWLGGDVSMLE